MPQNYTVPPVIIHLYKLPLEPGDAYFMVNANWIGESYCTFLCKDTIYELCNGYPHKCIYLQGDINLQKRKLKEKSDDGRQVLVLES